MNENGSDNVAHGTRAVVLGHGGDAKGGMWSETPPCVIFGPIVNRKWVVDMDHGSWVVDMRCGTWVVIVNNLGCARRLQVLLQ